jgi:cytochrome c-type biogenesis protein CcmH/NrfG
MSDSKPAPARPGGAKDRKIKNFLLDARFQLKFAAYFVALTLIITALLGAFLVRTTDSLFSQISASVEARKRAADTSHELGNCTLNNELTKNMDDPDFAAKLADKSKAIDAAFEAERAAAQKQSEEVQQQQQWTLYALMGVLVAFIALIALTALGSWSVYRALDASSLRLLLGLSAPPRPSEGRGLPAYAGLRAAGD